ncbi:MAG: hypothetical protein PHT54_00325 [Candidatus Nanoarchaeia archaeon]|nr:hypothetical protein [Candidatus Nanoarchaeia archaeon]
MKEPSSKFLVALAILAVGISITGIIASSPKLSIITGHTTGSVNISINSSLGISIVNADVNFTSSNPGDGKVSYLKKNIEGDACAADYACGFNLTNDGSILINISIQETESLFSSATFDNSKHLLYNTTHVELNYPSSAPGNGCSVGYPGGLSSGDWRPVPNAASEWAICSLNFTDDSDSVIVDINITIPDDELSGQKSGTLTFIATAS